MSERPRFSAKWWIYSLLALFAFVCVTIYLRFADWIFEGDIIYMALWLAGVYLIAQFVIFIVYYFITRNFPKAEDRRGGR